MDEVLVEKSMQIILSAGEARDLCAKALGKLEEHAYEEAAQLHEQAKKAIAKGAPHSDGMHSGAVAGEEFEYNVLFAHAQDTMMTVFSEINIAGHLIKLFQSINK